MKKKMKTKNLKDSILKTNQIKLKIKNLIIKLKFKKEKLNQIKC